MLAATDEGLQPVARPLVLEYKWLDYVLLMDGVGG